jgi:hypothetical protein
MEEAMRHAAEAIAFALEGGANQVSQPAGRIEYLPVTVG